MNGLLLGGIVESISTRKDRTVKVVFGTQELSPSVAGELMRLQNNLVAVYVSTKEAISQKEMDQVDKIDPEFEGKSQSQRIRNVLYKLWEQASEGYKDFNLYYQSKTEMYIEHLKSKIKD
jgi:hypothetical protein